MDSDINELKTYYNSVIDWSTSVFTDVESIMRGLPWGELYEKYHNKPMSEVHKQIDTFSSQAENEKDERKKKEMILKAKVAKKSMKYLDRTAGELKKIAK